MLCGRMPHPVHCPVQSIANGLHRPGVSSARCRHDGEHNAPSQQHRHHQKHHDCTANGFHPTQFGSHLAHFAAQRREPGIHTLRQRRPCRGLCRPLWQAGPGLRGSPRKWLQPPRGSARPSRSRGVSNAALMYPSPRRAARPPCVWLPAVLHRVAGNG